MLLAKATLSLHCLQHVTFYLERTIFIRQFPLGKDGPFCFPSSVCLFRKKEMGCSRLFRPTLTHPRVSSAPLKVWESWQFSVKT